MVSKPQPSGATTPYPEFVIMRVLHREVEDHVIIGAVLVTSMHSVLSVF